MLLLSLLDLLTFLFVLVSHQSTASPTTDGIVCGGALVTATDQTEGVELRIYPPPSFPVPPSDSTTIYKTLELTGYSLSSECGELYTKCENLLVINVNNSTNSNSTLDKQQQQQQQHLHWIIAIPLVNAIALLGLDFSTSSELKEDVYVVQHNYDCSSDTIHHIRDSYYTICSNSENGIVVKLLELRLDTTHLSQSYLHEMQQARFDSVLTNSLYISLPSRSGDYIFFATGQSVLYFDPLNNLIGELDVQLDPRECYLSQLVYIGGWNMFAYCNTSQAVYIDIDAESVVSQANFSTDGRPYICPNPDVYLAVYVEAGYIQYGFRSTFEAENFNIQMSAYDNGVCLGSKDTTLFVFTDRERGTRLLNATGGFIKSLSESTCINYPCRPLVVLDDRYLILREKREGDWHISVLDSENSFYVIHHSQHVSADLFTWLDISSEDCDIGPSEEVPTVTATSSAYSVVVTSPTLLIPDRKSHSTPHFVIPITIVAGLVILVTIIATSVVFIVLYLPKRRSIRLYNELGHEQSGHTDSKLVSGMVMEETVEGGGFESKELNGADNVSVPGGKMSQSSADPVDTKEGVQESGTPPRSEEMVANVVDNSSSDAIPLIL